MDRDAPAMHITNRRRHNHACATDPTFSPESPEIPSWQHRKADQNGYRIMADNTALQAASFDYITRTHPPVK
jgi:hypothetical protein